MGKLASSGGAFGLWMMVFIFFTALGQAGQRNTQELKIETKRLEKLFKKKNLILRNFWTGSQLDLDGDGISTEEKQTGDWTLFSTIRMDSVRLKSGKWLLIKGRRIYYGYDSGSNQFQGLISTDPVVIRIEMKPEDYSVQQLRIAWQRIFLSSKERFHELLPDYWQAFFRKQEEEKAKTGKDLHSADDKMIPLDAVSSSIKEDNNPRETSAAISRPALPEDVTPPETLDQSEPAYPELAVQRCVSGTVIVRGIVEKDGSIKNVALVKPLGYGLDEAAVKKINTWKFRPARKKGQPVDCYVIIKIEFSL